MLNKQCKVVMLPTEKPSKIGYLTQIGKKRNDLRYYGIESPNILDSENQYIYVLSDCKIYQDDYIFKDGEISIANDEWCGDTDEKWKKIIATNDPSLNLPTLSDDFLKEYCEKNGINEIVVDFESNMNQTDLEQNEMFEDDVIEWVKVNDKNEISISTMKKDSWNNQERLNFAIKFAEHCLREAGIENVNCIGEMLNFEKKWIEKNS